MLRPVLLLVVVPLAIALTGCGSKPPAKAGTAVSASAATPTLRQLRNGETLAYAVRGKINGLDPGTHEYLTVQVARGGGATGEMRLLYSAINVHSRRRSRSERPFGVPAERSIKVRTASHRFSQDAGGTLRWHGPVDGGYLVNNLVESCFVPEVRSPLSVGQAYDSGTTGLLNPHSGATATTGHVRYRVTGVEKVHVPAGTFAAFRVEFEVTRDEANKQPHRWTDWYTGDRLLVKREETSPGIALLGVETRFTQTLELLPAPPTFPESWKRE